TFDAPATVAIAAHASDADGTVTNVEFFNGTAKLGEDGTAPYAYTWTGVPAGTYSLTARATDNDGRTAVSAPVGITVRASNAPPAVAITAPGDGDVFGWKEPVTIGATASDSDGSVRKVEFFSNDGVTKLGEDTTAPYSFTWRKATSGTHSLRARATDDGGAVTTSAAVRITVRDRRG
ncbi:MAG TPA: Ig-like domain-containing protein, partial [Solirubrobacteraceae bacterium]|nr:Ig-like domain-containing protein [Solirubrobacteraceae bacterium]